MKLVPCVLAVLGLVLSIGPRRAIAAGSVVRFNGEGIAQVDGKPFFPLGIFTYHLDSTVMAEIHENRFNTIVNGFKPDQLNYIRDNDLMAICFTGPKWLDAATTHPALLAWYLMDEPEGHSKSPETLRKEYLALKERDPNHPIGLCHFLFDALAKYKDCCDFTMTDVYPVTAHRDTPLRNVGVHIDEAHRVHGPGWPDWADIQVFGGPDTDNGKWAQPLPDEVRCMAFIALVHRATGILYFSYWPRAPRTWDSLKGLNEDILRITPWLVAPGREGTATASDAQIEVRLRRTIQGGILLAVNTQPTFTDTTIHAPGMKNVSLLMPLEGSRHVKMQNGTVRTTFFPYEAKVYTWGPEPIIEWARRR